MKTENGEQKVDVEKLAQNFIDSFGSEGFHKAEDGKYWYTSSDGVNGIDLKYYFELLIEEVLETQALQSQTGKYSEAVVRNAYLQGVSEGQDPDYNETYCDTFLQSITPSPKQEEGKEGDCEFCNGTGKEQESCCGDKLNDYGICKSCGEHCATLGDDCYECKGTGKDKNL